jgi:hypothetical protein
MTTVSFARDIAPTLSQYRDEMAWRLDLASYEDVKANADIILGYMNGAVGTVMPPPPFDPFPQSFIDTFSNWIKASYPP